MLVDKLYTVWTCIRWSVSVLWCMTFAFQTSGADDNLGHSEKPDYIVGKGVVTFIKHDNPPYYASCPNENCKKKVTESIDGGYMCEKCEKTHNRCTYR